MFEVGLNYDTHYRAKAPIENALIDEFIKVEGFLDSENGLMLTTAALETEGIQTMICGILIHVVYDIYSS